MVMAISVSVAVTPSIFLITQITSANSNGFDLKENFPGAELRHGYIFERYTNFGWIFYNSEHVTLQLLE